MIWHTVSQAHCILSLYQPWKEHWFSLVMDGILKPRCLGIRCAHCYQGIIDLRHFQWVNELTSNSLQNHKLHSFLHFTFLPSIQSVSPDSLKFHYFTWVFHKVKGTNPNKLLGQPYIYVLVQSYSTIMQQKMATHSTILTWEIPWTEEPASYSPWDHKESDTTEHANIVQSKQFWNFYTWRSIHMRVLVFPVASPTNSVLLNFFFKLLKVFKLIDQKKILIIILNLHFPFCK